MDIKNKHALVTGATSGLGLDIAKLLVQEGCNVMILGRDKIKTQKALKELDSKLATSAVCDLKDINQIKHTTAKIKELDILINCAGMISYHRLEKQDPKNVKDLIDTNLMGTILITSSVLKLMKSKNQGTIINISSASALPGGGSPYEAVYMATKYGITGFSEGIKKELEKENKKIRVITVYPGGMKTELFAKSGLKKDVSKLMDPMEIAKVIIFALLRPDSVKMDPVVIHRNK